MSPEVAQTIVQTFLSELDIATKNFQAAQSAAQAASSALDDATVRLTAIINIKASLLQFPDIMNALTTLSIPTSALGG